MTGKKLQAVVSLLQAIKFDTKKLNWLLSEDAEVPEDFTPDDIADDYLDTRKQVAESDLDVQKQISDALKAQEQAQYKKLIGSIRTKLKRRAHFDADKELDLDGLVDAYEKAVGDGAKGTDSEYKTKFEKVNQDYTDALDKIEALEAEKIQLAEHNQKFESQYEEKLKSKTAINEAFGSIEWAEQGEMLQERQRLMSRDIEDRLIVKGDGSITDKDGKPVMKADGTGRIKTIKEWTESYVDRFKLRKVSNGKEDIKKMPNGKQIPDGKDGETLKQKLRERKEFIEQKAKEYGVSQEEAEEMFQS